MFRRRRARLEDAAEGAAVTAFTALEQRLPVTEAARALLRKAFPDHWSFLLGEIALYSFLVLVLTGTYLTLFFDPSMAETVYHGRHIPLDGTRMSHAYASTLDISFAVRGGLLIRQIHHWASLVFLAAVGVHLLRVFFTGAFRRPREMNWMIGVTLFMLAMLEGFAGYSLPDDSLSGTGLRTANSIVTSIPFAGTYLNFFLWGGPYPGTDIIPRLYVLHILLIPGIILALVGLHLMLVVVLKHTHWNKRGHTNRNVVGQPMVPQFTAKSTGLFLMIFGVLAGLAAVTQINPVWDYGPYRPDQVATDAQPDWYVGFLEGGLRLMPPFETNLWGHTVMWNVFIPTLVLPGLLFVSLYLYPFFERWVTGDRGEHHLCDRPRNRPTRTALGAAAVVFYAILLLGGGNDVIAYSFRVSVDALTWVLRVALVVAPVLAFLLTKRLCLALQAADRELLTEGEETGEVSQNVYGELTDARTGISADRAYRILVRDVPEPLPGPADGRTARGQRLRIALSGWYYRDHVPMPADAEQRREIGERTAAPDRASGR
nr:ubiquinol-cytochrome c reductase cytochrome b subunit [Streptomyces sp. Ru73]